MDEDDFQPARRDRGPYAPFTDDDYGYDARDEAPPRRWLFLGLIVISALSLIAILFNTYRMGTRERNDGNPPRIAAAGAYKAAPKDVGGTSTPGQGIIVYDLIDGSQRSDTISPVITREELADLPDALDEMAQGGPPVELRRNAQSGPVDGDLSDLGSLPDAEEPRPQPSLPVRDLAPSVTAPAPMVAPVVAPQTAPNPAPNPAPQATAPAAAPSGIRFSPSGGYRVQVAAVRSDAEADALWAKLLGQHPDVMAGATKDVQRADLGEKGIFYRVRAGRFADRANADAFCSALKARGTDCLIVSP